MIIDIEGVGLRDVPDDSTPDDIKRIVKKLTTPETSQSSLPQEATIARKIFPSVGRAVDIYKQETGEGMQAINKFTEEPTGRSAINAATGLLRYGFAPVTAFAKGIVAEPIVNPMRSAGLPESIAGPTEQFIEGAATMVPYGGLVQRSVRTLSEAQKAAEAAGLIRGEAASAAVGKAAKKKLEFAPQTSEETIQAVGQPVKGAIPQAVAEGTPIATKIVATDTAAKEVIDAVKGGVKWQPSGERRIGQEVIDYISQNREEIPRVLKKYDMTPTELAAEMKETYTTAGRHLGQLGWLARKLQKEFKTPEMQKLASSLLEDLPEPTALDNFMSGFRKVENVRRAMLVAQTATTMRNVISQTGRMGLGMFDDALKGGIEGAMHTGPIKETAVDTLKGIGQGLDTVSALWHRITPSGRKAFSELIDQDNALKAKALMYGSPVQDVVMGDKFTKAVNVLNRTQEFFFRNVAFESKLNQMLEQAGVKGGLKAVNPANIPESMFTKAAEHALEMTFQASAKSKTGKDFVKFMSQPYMTALFNPFPRFLWANSVPFLRDFSPLGFVKALDPKTAAKMASGDSTEFAKAASRATLGTLMMNGALKVRSDPTLAGEKWYELNVNGKSVDVRAFAPFSTYLFLAEAMVHPDKVKAADWGQALLSLNRVAGTGLVLTDVLRGKKFETVMNISNRIAGEWLGSFSTPVRTFKDLYTMVDPNEATIRDIREKEFTGPTQRNIPELSQELPEAINPLQQGPMKAQTPILRQTTGIAYRTKTPLEAEVDRLQVDMSSVQPRTGIPEADRLIATAMQPLSRQMEEKVLQNPLYAKASAPMQRIIMRDLFKEARKMAKQEVYAANPTLAKKAIVKGIDEDLKELFGDRLNELMR